MGRSHRRFVVDPTWRRVGTDHRTVLAGSPLRLFRLSPAGAEIADRIESGGPIEGGGASGSGIARLVERFLDAGAIHPVPTRHIATSGVTVVTPQLDGIALPQRLTVDDGSDPPIAGAATRLTPNRGPAAARNAGRRLVTTPLVAFVDRDVELPAGWLESLLPHFDDPAVGLVAPRVTGDPGSSLDLGTDPGRVRAGTRVSYVPAAAIVVRTDAFDDVGGFDETLRFGEDVDFVWRLDAAGWRVRYEPTSIVSHRRRATLRGRLHQQVGYGSSTAALELRHPGLLAPHSVNAWTVAVWAALLLGRPRVATATAIGSAVALMRRIDDLDAATALRIGLVGHLQGTRRAAEAVRRSWWPLAALAALLSRRARWATLVAFAASPRHALRDIAFGWGVWRGMVERRTWRPIVPTISSTSRRDRGRRRQEDRPTGVLG